MKFIVPILFWLLFGYIVKWFYKNIRARFFPNARDLEEKAYLENQRKIDWNSHPDIEMMRARIKVMTHLFKETPKTPRIAFKNVCQLVQIFEFLKERNWSTDGITYRASDEIKSTLKCRVKGINDDDIYNSEPMNFSMQVMSLFKQHLQSPQYNPDTDEKSAEEAVFNLRRLANDKWFLPYNLHGSIKEILIRIANLPEWKPY